MTDIAIAACRSSQEAAPDDLTPDPDFPLLAEAFATIAMSCCQLAWDNPKVRWADFAAVVIRSTWDGDVRPEAYLAWAEAASAHTSLGADGVPIVPTRFVLPGQAWAPPEAS